jgi:hypothetical protein
MCQGDSSQLQAIAYGGSGNYTYSWSSVPSGFSSTQPNPKVCPSDTTVYIVAISDGSDTRIDTTEVRIVPQATANAGEDTTLCAWAPSVPVSGTISNARDFRWGTTGDGHIMNPHSLSTSYVPGAEDKINGFVDLVLLAYAKSPCTGKVTDMKHLLIDPCTTIPETSREELKIEISPNPAADFVNITLYGLREKAVISLTGIDGIIYTSSVVEPIAEKTVRSLNINGYNKGIYIVKVRTDNQIKTEKLVIR